MFQPTEHPMNMLVLPQRINRLSQTMEGQPLMKEDIRLTQKNRFQPLRKLRSITQLYLLKNAEVQLVRTIRL